MSPVLYELVLFIYNPYSPRSNISICLSNDIPTPNKQKERPDELIYKYRTLNTHIINIQEVWQIIHKCVPKHKIFTNYSMNKQYMKGLQKQ